MLRPDGTSTSPHIADKDTRNAAFICLASASSVMGLLDPDHKDADYPLVLTRLSTAAVKGKAPSCVVSRIIVPVGIMVLQLIHIKQVAWVACAKHVLKKHEACQITREPSTRMKVSNHLKQEEKPITTNIPCFMVLLVGHVTSTCTQSTSSPYTPPSKSSKFPDRCAQ